MYKIILKKKKSYSALGHKVHIVPRKFKCRLSLLISLVSLLSHCQIKQAIKYKLMQEKRTRNKSVLNRNGWLSFSIFPREISPVARLAARPRCVMLTTVLSHSQTDTLDVLECDWERNKQSWRGKKMKALLRDATDTEAHRVWLWKGSLHVGSGVVSVLFSLGDFAQSPPISVDSSQSVLSQETKSRDASVS